MRTERLEDDHILLTEGVRFGVEEGIRCSDLKIELKRAFPDENIDDLAVALGPYQFVAGAKGNSYAGITRCHRDMFKLFSDRMIPCFRPGVVHELRARMGQGTTELYEKSVI